MTPLRHETKKIISVTTENKFISPVQSVMINNYQGRKEELEIYRFSPSDEPNPMSHHMKKLISLDEGWNKASNPDYTNKIILVTPRKKNSGVPKLSSPAGIRGENWGLTYLRFTHIIIPVSLVSIGTY